MSDKASSLLPLPEELYLRALTGRLVGEHLFDGYSKVAVVIYPDRICAAMGASALTSFTYMTGYRSGIGAVFLYEKASIGKVAKEIVDKRFDLVYIAYGGEQKMSVVNEASKDTLKALAVAGFKGALAIHVRVWLATKQLSTLLSERDLKEFLEKLPEIRVFTADLQSRKFLFNRVKISEGNALLATYREVLLTDEHVELLKRSIPPPE